MAYATVEVDLDDYIGDFTDKELIEELKARGYKVDEHEELTEVEWCWRRGDKKEALILLEREFKWLRGISELAN